MFVDAVETLGQPNSHRTTNATRGRSVANMSSSSAALAALIQGQGEASASHFDDFEPSLPDHPDLISLQSSFQSPPPRLPPQRSHANTSSNGVGLGLFARKHSARNVSGMLGDEETPSQATRNARFADETEDSGAALSLADTPVRERSLTFFNADTPVPAPKPKRTRASLGSGTRGPTNLTLREQEKVIDDCKKENFSLKLKVHFLEERLNELAPEQLLAAAQSNTQLKVEVAARGKEIKQYKKLILELERELEAFGRDQNRGPGADMLKERLQAGIDERDAEIADLRKKLKQAESASKNPSPSKSAAANAKLEEEIDRLQEQNDVLFQEIEEMKVNLTETTEEMLAGRGETPALRERILGLEDRIEEYEKAAENAEDERQLLADELEHAKAQVAKLQAEREDQKRAASASVAAMYDERIDNEALQENLGEARDRLAAANIELDQKENDLLESQRFAADLEEECAALQEELGAREEEYINLQQVLTQLQEQHNGCEREREEIMVDHDNEIQSANAELAEMSEKLVLAEGDVDRFELALQQVQTERDEADKLHEEVLSGLKDRLQQSRSEYDHLNEVYEGLQADLEQAEGRLKHQQGTLDQMNRDIDALEDELDVEKRARERAEINAQNLEEKVADAEDRLKREVDSLIRDTENRERKWKRDALVLESALKDKSKEVDSLQSLVDQRKSDVSKLQSALNDAETKSRKLGETHTTDRFSLELELERVRRDLTRTEEDLARAKEDLVEKEAKARQRENELDQLHADKRDLENKLATQTQARLNVAEKLDSAQAGAKAADLELNNLRSRVTELEGRLSKEQRELIGAEKQYRDQLTERNTLLLTVWQYMDQILGVDKTPKKGSAAQTKPFTNFAVFHENMTGRLAALGRIRSDFEKKVQEAEARQAEKLKSIQKQAEGRWRQIDKWEGVISKIPDLKSSWRRKYQAKEGELEAAKSNLAELQSQLSALKKSASSSPSDLSELRALSARVKNAENRAMVAENLKSKAERDLAYHKERHAGEVKHHEQSRQLFEDRLKEHERNEKLAEERLKREKQGGKERIRELEKQIAQLGRGVEDANKRDSRLSGVLETRNKPAPK